MSSSRISFRLSASSLNFSKTRFRSSSTGHSPIRQLAFQRMPSECLPKPAVGGKPNHLRLHDFIGHPVLENAVLVNARLMAKAFAPTTALLGCTTMPVIMLTSLLAGGFPLYGCAS